MKTMTKFLTLIVFVFTFISCEINDEMRSPDNSTIAKLEVIEGSFKLNLIYKNEILLRSIDL
ncbi:unnamed protein product, partial [marine sediment metagenome]